MEERRGLWPSRERGKWCGSGNCEGKMKKEERTAKGSWTCRQFWATVSRILEQTKAKSCRLQWNFLALTVKGWNRALKEQSPFFKQCRP